jgi:glycosyltransferase involved in cell wall biosynthesis
MSPRRRLLFVSPCTPDPRGTGWEQRAYSFLLAYSRFMDIDLWFVPTADNLDLSRSPSLPTLCKSLTAFYASVFNDVQSGFLSRFRLKVQSADVVHISRFPELVHVIGHRCIVWDIDELPDFVRHSGWGEHSSGSPDAKFEQLRADYRHAVQNSKAVIGCSPLEQPPDCHTFTVIPNIVNFPSRSEAAIHEKNLRLLFVGNLNFAPNIEALVFLAEKVVPILDQLVPGICITIVGRAPNMDFARATIALLQQSNRFEFAIDVQDCTPHYNQSTVAIVPLQSGAGTRIKILEAFAHGCPVVSTTKGCEGLDVHHDNELLIADSAEGFAQACVDFLRGSPLRERIAKNARAFVALNHSQQLVDRLLALTVSNLLNDS